ncbi:MAG: aminoacyl--tRNA ligase-related protein [bacterium]
MKQSQLFYSTLKEAPKDEKSINAQLLIRAGFIEKVSAGIYNFLPLGLKVLNRIEKIIREEIEKVGGQEILMPALHPKEFWQKTGRWETFEDLYKLKDGDKEFALGPTHEEIIVPLAKSLVKSYQDLPFYLFQIQTKFRREKRAKSGLLRAREFLMKDLYSFHASEGDLDDYYEIMKKTYAIIFQKVGLEKNTFLTYASGGSFAKYSHEFQTLTPAGEDLIYICDKCQMAINREIKEETPRCPACDSNSFHKEKAIEVGNIFKLKTRFSEPFKFEFIDKNGQAKPVLMGCYGIGLGRLMGTIVEIFHDDKGIAWPQSVSPFKIHLLAIGSEESFTEAERIYRVLQEAGNEVLYDDRKKSGGEKLVEADLIGLPIRIVVSDKSLKDKSVEVKKRSGTKITFIKTANLERELADICKNV